MPKFQKRHYIAIAAVLADIADDPQQRSLFSDLTAICRAFATYFAADNPRFDADRFLSACGVQHDR